MKNIEVLKKSYLFSNIENEEIEKVINCLNPIYKNFQKGESVIRVGEMVENFGIIISGKAHIIQEDYWGNKNIISEINQSDVFAEVFATLSIKSEVSVVATTEVKIVFLNAKNIISTCSNHCYYHNILIKNLLTSTAEKNLKITQKLIHTSKKTIRDKLLSYLSTVSIKKESTKFKIPFNRQDLANYLGVDRSALSNEISKLQKEGIIKSEKNSFELIKDNLMY